jgi:hypothetical protein
VSDGYEVWFAGGFVGNNPGIPVDEVWRYNTLTDTWTAGPPLPEPRASGAFIKAGRELHYLGGLSFDRQTDYDNHWVLNLDNLAAGWINEPALPTARNHLSGMAIDGLVYGIGGQFGHDQSYEDVTIVDVYDTVNDEWLSNPSVDLPAPRSHFEPGIIKYRERIIIVGGRDTENAGDVPVDEILIFNPQTGTWSGKADGVRTLPVEPEDTLAGLLAPVAEVINDQLIVTAGGRFYNDAQQQTWISNITTDCEDVSTPTPDPTVPVPTQQPLVGPIQRLNPLDGQIVENLDVTFQWQADANADGYHLYVTDGADTPVIDEMVSASVCTVQTCEVVRTLADGTHRWYIAGVNESGTGSWGEPQPMAYTFYAGAPIAQIGPTNGTVLTNAVDGVTFTWTDIGSSWYGLYVDQTVFGLHFEWYLRSEVCNGETCSTTLTLANGSHTWYVARYDEWSDSTEWTEASTFQVNVGVSSQTTNLQVLPGEFAADTRLAWTDTATASWYRLWIASGETVAMDEWHQGSEICSQGVCTVPLTSLENGQYTWVVANWGPGGLGPNSAPTPLNIAVDAAPDMLQTIAPSGTVTEPAVTFQWQQSDYAAWYHLQVTDASGITVFDQWRPWYELCAAGTCTWMVNELVDGAYTWQVESWGPAGMGAATVPISFTLDAASPGVISLLSPTGFIASGLTDLTWSHDVSAAWYHVFVSQDGRVVMDQWVSAADSCLAESCSLTNQFFMPGSYTWYVQPWSPGGLGPLSLTQSFSVQFSN